MNYKTAAVVGTGMMGPGIATTLLLGGLKVVLLSRTMENAAHGCLGVLQQLELLQANGLVDSGRAAMAGQNLSSSSDFDSSIAAADLVVESTPESMELKQKLFLRMSQLNSTGTLASNTSGLSITSIAQNCVNPGRVLTSHFWNPPHLMPLVEIVSGEKTDAIVADNLAEFLRSCGKVPVKVKKDTPGQLGSRLQMALYREALHIVQEGIADVEDVDLAAKSGFGLRLPVYGIFEHQDVVGLQMSSSIANYVMPHLCHTPGPPPLLEQLMQKGALGANSGRGYYDWTKKSLADVKDRRDRFVMEVVKKHYSNPTPDSQTS